MLLAVWLVHANSFGNAFHFDDFHTIRNNPAVRSLRNLPRTLTDATAFSVVPANQTYRPLVTGSLALDYALAGGYDVFWFHLSTFVWLLVLLAVLYFFFESLFDAVRPSPVNRWLALGGCAWFGLHPAMAETVNYIIQRADLFCTLCYIVRSGGANGIRAICSPSFDLFQCSAGDEGAEAATLTRRAQPARRASPVTSFVRFERYVWELLQKDFPVIPVDLRKKQVFCVARQCEPPPPV